MDAVKIDRWYSRNAANLAEKGVIVGKGSKITRQIVAHLVRDGRVRAFADAHGDIMVVDSSYHSADHTAEHQLGRVNRYTRRLTLTQRAA